MKIPYFDSHCDTLLRILNEGGHLKSNSFHIALERTKHYKPYVQVFACFSDMGAKFRGDTKSEQEFIDRCISGDFEPDYGIYDQFEALTRVFYTEIERNRDIIMPCRSASDIEKAIKLEKSAAILGVEGAEQIEKIGIEGAFELGVRVLTITWNYRNAYAGSCVTGGGLTEEGRKLVKRAGELGIIMDVSHASEETFWDIAQISEKPFIASHSNSKVLCPHRRNLTDEQFKAIIKAGGVAGINLYSDFIVKGRQATIDDTIAHIEHFMELGGEKNIAIGADLDGCETIPEGMNGVEDVELIWEALARKNYQGDTLHNIFFGNLIRVFKAMEQK